MRKLTGMTFRAVKIEEGHFKVLGNGNQTVAHITEARDGEWHITLVETAVWRGFDLSPSKSLQEAIEKLS